MAAAELTTVLIHGGGDIEVADLVDDIDLIAGRRSGQTFSSDVAARRAVERHAMDVTEAALIEDGWHVEDVSGYESFDFLCTMDKLELRVEVKGTRGAGEQVIVTRLEVEHAQDRQDVHLAIVSDITVTRDENGAPIASGGSLRWHRPWSIVDEDLTAVAYTWRPPIAADDDHGDGRVTPAVRDEARRGRASRRSRASPR
jgi:hypothetical protein